MSREICDRRASDHVQCCGITLELSNWQTGRNSSALYSRRSRDDTPTADTFAQCTRKPNRTYGQIFLWAAMSAFIGLFSVREIMMVRQSKAFASTLLLLCVTACATISEERSDAGSKASVRNLAFDSRAELQARAQRIVDNAKAAEYFQGAAQVKLAEAASESDLNGMGAAIANGAEVNKEGRDGITPLFWALSKQEFPAFQLLLEQGADPNKIMDGGRDSNAGYSSALAMAAAIPDSRYLQAALQHGGDPNLSMNGWHQPVIYQAIMHGNLDNVKLLVEGGADINYQDKAGQTPLITAVLATQYKIALYLLRSGADPTIKDNLGGSPVDIVMQFGDRGIDTRTGDLEAYDEFVAELQSRGVLHDDPPRFR